MLTSLIRFHLKKLKSEDQFQVKSNAKEIMLSKIERERLKEKRQRQRDKYRETDTERERKKGTNIQYLNKTEDIT